MWVLFKLWILSAWKSVWDRDWAGHSRWVNQLRLFCCTQLIYSSILSKIRAKYFWTHLMSRSTVSNTSMLLCTSFGHSRFTRRLWNLKHYLRLKGLTSDYLGLYAKKTRTYIFTNKYNLKTKGRRRVSQEVNLKADKYERQKLVVTFYRPLTECEGR